MLVALLVGLGIGSCHFITMRCHLDIQSLHINTKLFTDVVNEARVSVSSEEMVSSVVAVAELAVLSVSAQFTFCLSSLGRPGPAHPKLSLETF